MILSFKPLDPHAVDEGLDIATMFELSLAIGKSLDLQDSAEAFFSQILSRLNLAAIALFVRTARLEGSDPAAPDYLCCSSVPRLGGARCTIPENGPLATALRAHGIKELSGAEVESLQPVFRGYRIDDGTHVGFAHGEDVLVLLHIGWRQTPLPKWQLSQLQLILTKFAHSIETCLDHELLRRESARRIELQEQLIRAQRLEALGLLAGGMAHDLNNIITPLLGYPAIVRSALPEDSLARIDLDVMEEAAGRAASMISGMLSSATTARPLGTQLPLNKSIEDYLSSPEFQVLRSQHADVEFQSELRATGQILGSVRDIGRVMMNLVHNAFDAHTGGGFVRVESLDVLQEDDLYGYEVVPPGAYGRLRVEDNGSGIPCEMLGRVFEPFVSTKSDARQGRGLGLSVVHSLVKGMAGYLDLQSSPAGTVFDLYLPLVEPQDGGQSAPQSGAASSAPGEHTTGSTAHPGRRTR